MTCVTVTYACKEDGRFDWDYYVNKHVPLVNQLLRTQLTVRKGIVALDGSPPAAVCVASIPVNSLEEFQAMMAEHGEAIMGDVPNYTNITPTGQVDEIL
jgi:uncharacterized protein (TIGR02118 family)